MPRQTRLDILTVLHRVIVRGIERRDIFDDERILGSGDFWKC